MKKRILFLLIVMLFYGGLQANPVGVQTAKSLGIKFMKANTEMKSVSAELTYTAFADNGQAAFYVFTMQPKGFVIVSADDRAKPILGYSTEGAFSNEIPEGLESFFRNYQAGFSQMIANNEERTEMAVRDWNRLAETGRINDAKITREVSPLLTCTWNQSALYNRFCPEDEMGPDGHVYAGCVATAISQIMYYWQWPNVGRSMYAYEQYPYGELFANFGNTHYHFDLMPDFLDWTSSEEEIDAVARLMYHAGVGVAMAYSPEGSGALSQRVTYAMSEYFIYDPQPMELRAKNYYTGQVWDDMLRENLDGNMPLYYSASGNAGGHAFVCDGYDENDMFHFNWGWQGLDNGFYPIDGFYLSNYSFPDGHAAIFGIVPDCYPYCYAPKSVEDFRVEPVADGTNRIQFVSPSMVLGEWDIPQVDSVVLMRNNEVIHTDYNVAAGTQLSYDDHGAIGISYYSVVPFSGQFPGPVVKDTILNGPTCDLTFHLHDLAGDGWIAPALSLVDSRGIVVKRLGLTEGDEATVKVEVPSSEQITIYWAYTVGGKDYECSFEIYDWDGHLVCASGEYLWVGELCSLYVDCSDDVAENDETIVSVYPNPTHSQIMIEGVEASRVDVFNALGQCVLVSCHQVIDLSELEAGIYFVRIEASDGQVYFEKVMKQ